MGAAGLFRVPLLGPALRALGAFPIARRDRDLARRQLAEVAAAPWASDVVIFPEGDIAPTGEPLPFRMGAFALAIETGATVVPVALHHTGDLLPLHGRLRVRPGVVRTQFLAPIPTTDLTTSDREALRDRVHDAVFSALNGRLLPH
jgi:1-acyl-sn-glycerol-3-phosphate acyltransferase